MKHKVQHQSTRRYKLTREGRQKYLTRLHKLQASRRETLQQIRYLSDQQAASMLLDRTEDMSMLQKIDQELAELNFILAHSSDCHSTSTNTIGLGTKVTLRSKIRQSVVVLVESIEADPSRGYISLSSPLGRLLMGKHAHDQLMLETKRGRQHYEVLAVN